MALIGNKHTYLLFLGLICLQFARGASAFTLDEGPSGLEDLREHVILYEENVTDSDVGKHLDNLKTVVNLYNQRMRVQLNHSGVSSTLWKAASHKVEYIKSKHIRAAVVTIPNSLYIDVLLDPLVKAVEPNYTIRFSTGPFVPSKTASDPISINTEKPTLPRIIKKTKHLESLLREEQKKKKHCCKKKNHHIPRSTPREFDLCGTPERLWAQKMISCNKNECGNIDLVPKSLGEGVYVFVVDSGVNNAEEYGSRLKYSLNLVPDENDSMDKLGHGTMTAGLAASESYGIAKKANVVSIKIIGSQFSSDLARVIRALAEISNYREKHKIETLSIANLSLGVPISHLMENVIARLFYSGVIVSSSAGNSGTDACTFSPAGTALSLTVGSINKNFEISDFSNYGPCVDLFAPGENVASVCSEKNCFCRTASGTSFSAPIVSGITAVAISENPKLNAHDIKKLVIQSSKTNIIKSHRPLTIFRLATTDLISQKA